MIWYNFNKIRNFKEAKENKAWSKWKLLEETYGRYQAVFGLRDQRVELQISEAKRSALSYINEAEIAWLCESGKLPGYFEGRIKIEEIEKGTICITDQYFYSQIFETVSDSWFSNGYRELVVSKDGLFFTFHLYMDDSSFEYDESYDI